MKLRIVFLLISFTASAGRDDDAMMQSATGRVMLQHTVRDIVDKEQDSDAANDQDSEAANDQDSEEGKCPKWCPKSAKKTNWKDVCSWKDKKGRAKCRNCQECGGGGGGGQCSPKSCVGCGGCTLTACKESESCCNHYKDLQNRINDVKQNWGSRGSPCDKQLGALFDEYDQKMKNVGKCSSMSVTSPCMKCFACRSQELSFCPKYIKELGCGAFSLLSVNGSLQGEGSENIALVSRAAVREGDHTETTDSVFRSKNCL